MTRLGPAEQLPYPPAGDRWPLPVLRVDIGTHFFRLTRQQHVDPAFFGRLMLHRFDAPDGTYGVCYLGTSLECCFLETIYPHRQPDTTRRFIARAHLSSYNATVITLLRPLELACLADDGLVHLGIDQRVTGGEGYHVSQAWSSAIHGHARAVDGVFYASRHHNGLYSVALFDRAQGSVEFARWGSLEDRNVRDLWRRTIEILERFQIELLDAPSDGH